jgi:hypothetical protein
MRSRWSCVRSASAAGLVALTSAVLVVPGCGGSVSPQEVCQKACDCAGACSEADVAECASALEQAEDAAEQIGCSGEYDDYLACIDDGLDECRFDVESDCAEEARAIEACAGSEFSEDDPPPDVEGACDRLFDELAGCPSYEMSEPPACSFEEDTMAACMLERGVDLCDPSQLEDAAAACQPSG